MTTNRGLNHTELVYPPGGRALAKRVFEVLGCRVIDPKGPYLVIQLDPAGRDALNNVLYASEATPEQWQLECALRDRLDQDDDLGKAARGYVERFDRVPQSTTHFGIRMPSVEHLDGVLAAIESATDELGDHLWVSGVFRPGDPGSLSDDVVQAFIKTDACAAGLLTLGQHIELQAQLV